MSLLFAIMLAVHGIIHLLGAAKAFGIADLPQITQPVSPMLGALWLVAALLFLAVAVAIVAWPRSWWAIGAIAIAVSTAVIAASWTDAKFGMVANAVAFAGVAFAFLTYGPISLRAAYDRDVASALGPAGASTPITHADLARLPEPVRRYLHVTGSRMRTHSVYARMHGRIRSGRDARWIPFSAEQVDVFRPIGPAEAGPHDTPARMFYLTGSMFGVPVQGYHRYIGPSASMTIKAAALIPVARASGPEMDQAETVTLFNDMCVFAPATLVDPAIQWEEVDAHTVRAAFTNAGHTIRAELSFNDAGELVDFASDDRYQTSPDGRISRQIRWSTPIRDYRAFDGVRLGARGEGRWHETAGDYAYVELEIDEIRYNVAPR